MSTPATRFDWVGFGWIWLDCLKRNGNLAPTQCPEVCKGGGGGVSRLPGGRGGREFTIYDLRFTRAGPCPQRGFAVKPLRPCMRPPGHACRPKRFPRFFAMSKSGPPSPGLGGRRATRSGRKYDDIFNRDVKRGKWGESIPLTRWGGEVGWRRGEAWARQRSY